MLDASAQRAASEQEGINAQALCRHLENQNADQPIIAKAVTDRNSEHLGGARKLVDFGSRAAARGAIELVGAQRKLGDAWHLCGGHGFDLDFQVQASQKIGQRQRFRPELLSVTILPVKLGAASVLGGAFWMVESPAMLEELRDALGIIRELQHQHLRASGLHLGAFPRVIINEDETVQTKPQFLRKGIEVLGFGPPVDSISGEMIQME